MLGLRFFNDAQPESSIIEGESFLFVADTVQRKPTGDTVARHIRDHWLVGGDSFLKIECSDLVECHFIGALRRSERRGPYQRVALIDGVLTGDGAPLALLLEGIGWRCLVGSETWSQWHLLQAAVPTDRTEGSRSGDAT
jgi:hypothetical protein